MWIVQTTETKDEDVTGLFNSPHKKAGKEFPNHHSSERSLLVLGSAWVSKEPVLNGWNRDFQPWNREFQPLESWFPTISLF